MQLITINVKGELNEAQAELTKRGILFKFGRTFGPDTTVYGAPLAQFLVEGRFATQVTQWFAERGAPPYAAGTLLHFRYHDGGEAIERALKDFDIAPYVGTDFPGLPNLTRRQAQTLCKSPEAISFDDSWIVRNKLTGEVIEGAKNEKRANTSADTLNDHAQAKQRQRVYVASKLA